MGLLKEHYLVGFKVECDDLKVSVPCDKILTFELNDDNRRDIIKDIAFTQPYEISKIRKEAKTLLDGVSYIENHFKDLSNEFADAINIGDTSEATEILAKLAKLKELIAIINAILVPTNKIIEGN